MKRFLARASVAGLSAALVAGVALVAAPAASAAQIGTLTFNGPADQTVGFTMTTSGACPATATNFQIRVTNDTTVSGNTAPTVSANITGNTAGSTIAGGINSGSFTATASANLQQFAANNGLGSQLPAGTYRFDLICRTVAASASLGDFSGRMVIGSGGSIVSAGPYLTQVATSTSVVASPASIDNSQVAPAGSTDFTATVTPSTAVGSVQFKVGATTIGLVPVSGGTATFTGYTDGTVGNGKVVTANFVGGADATNSYLDSSGTTTLDVTQAPAAATTTTLSLSPASVSAGDTSTATCAVTKSANSSAVTSGSVQFKVDGANLGSAVAVDGSGVATKSIGLLPGTYAITCDYQGNISFLGSTGGPASLEVVDNGPQVLSTDPQTVVVEVPAGTITIDTPYTAANPLDMGVMQLDGVAGYTASAFFGDITVADTRAGNTAWTAQALSSDFTKGLAGPTETISANNVGLILNAFSTTAANPNYLPNQPAGSAPAVLPTNFTGFDNPAGSYLPFDNVGNQGLGGTAPHAILHANQGLGTTIASGSLTITAPTSVTAGVYTGVITFTVIGS
ncbi:MAG: Ig-like domain repeat protein [Candidatus Nanopelagicales bacterium]